jgi:5-deoxy-glucuronate isomerase
MDQHLNQYRDGFKSGLTWITKPEEENLPTGIGMGVLKQKAGEEREFCFKEETAFLLMSGEATLEWSGESKKVSRQSLFDESSTCLHVSSETPVKITFEKDCEFTVYQVMNLKSFPARLWLPDDVPNEHRGAGQVGGACLRYVRTIMDRTTTHKNAVLVLGEVITMPGKWSSYPPHHHPQPEIYHYRFTRPEGFGYAEVGDHVYKIRQNDTVKIFDGQDHPQTAAPGYGMYYSWVIRHLEDNPYTVPEFTKEHIWTMDKGASFWNPGESS